MAQISWHKRVVAALQDIGEKECEVLYPSAIYVPISGGSRVIYRPDAVWLYGNGPYPKALIWEVETWKAEKTLCGTIALAGCAYEGCTYANESKYGKKIRQEVWVRIKYDKREKRRIAQVGSKRIYFRHCTLILILRDKWLQRLAEGLMESCLRKSDDIDWDSMVCRATSIESAHRSIARVAHRYL